jgi:membrane protein implicated in regulation of membrane protease activity
MVSFLGLVVILIGIALIIIEAVTPGTFIIVPGITLIIIGVLMIVFPGIEGSRWAPVLFLAIFVVIIVPVVYFYKTLSPPTRPITTSSSGLLGRTGHVKTTVTPGNIRGKVKIEEEIWSATSDQVIPEGTKVIVERVEGVKVIVRPLSEQELGVWEDTLEVDI